MPILNITCKTPHIGKFTPLMLSCGSDTNHTWPLSLTMVVSLVFAPVANAGWLDRLFHTDSCSESQQTTSDNFSICAKSVGEFTEKSEMGYPNYLEPLLEPSSGMTLTRVTDNTDSNNEDNPLLNHHYSKRQAWNFNETLVDLGGRILSAETYQPVLSYEPMSSARNWSNLHSEKLIGIRFNPDPNTLAIFDLRTEEYEEIARFDGYTNCSFGKGEGNLTNDDSRVLISCSNIHSGDTELIAYDLNERRILGQLVASENFNWASFSQSGKYILVENNTHPDPNPELLRYSHTLDNPIFLSPNPAHGDLALDTAGDDIYVMIYSNSVQTIRLRDRYKTDIPIGGFKSGALGSGHISCRALDRTGWCYISTYTSQRLGAVQLPVGVDDNNALNELYPIGQLTSLKASAYEHWGYHRSTVNSYSALAKASVSRSGRKIMFTSDWYGKHKTNDFVLEIPQERLP